MKELLVVDLGLMEYGAAWELQRRAVAARKAGSRPRSSAARANILT